MLNEEIIEKCITDNADVLDPFASMTSTFLHKLEEKMDEGIGKGVNIEKLTIEELWIGITLSFERYRSGGQKIKGMKIKILKLQSHIEWVWRLLDTEDNVLAKSNCFYSTENGCRENADIFLANFNDSEITIR